MLNPLNIDDPKKFFEDQGYVVEQLSDGMDYNSYVHNPETGIYFSGRDPNPIDSWHALLEKVCDTLWVECIAVEERRRDGR